MEGADNVTRLAEMDQLVILPGIYITNVRYQFVTDAVLRPMLHFLVGLHILKQPGKLSEQGINFPYGKFIHLFNGLPLQIGNFGNLYIKIIPTLLFNFCKMLELPDSYFVPFHLRSP